MSLPRTNAIGLAIALFVAVCSVRVATADDTPQPLPVTQSWSTTTLITANDNWSGVPGIEGRRGDDLTAATGVDPQTVLVDGGTTPLNVLANQVNPASLTTGGVAEFEIVDPVVALQGSGTADAPHLLIYVNTSGYQTITVSYTVRDLDDSADNAIQPVALHYRTGSSGAFANVPAAFVADATSGPSLATQTTAVSVTLPAAAENLPLVVLRIMTTNAAGNDEWVGIDDLWVTGTAAGDLPPSVAAVTPADGAVNVSPESTLTVQFSEAVTVTEPWLSLECTSSGVHTNTVTGGPVTYVVTPVPGFAPGESCTATVAAGQVTDQDDTPTPMATHYRWSFTVDAASACFDGSATRIHAVQGSGTVSPIISTTVTVEGVVVGDFQGSSSLRGFFVQEEDTDVDANPATSEGLFIFDTAAIDVAAGQTVRVTGVVTEFGNLTQLTNLVRVDFCGAGGTVTPQSVTLPVDDTGAWERYEGMLVTIPQDLTVTENFNLARFGELLLAAGGRLFQPTHIAAPGAEAALVAAANARNRILLDDANTQQNRDPIVYPTPGGLSAASTLRVGDRVNGLSGIVDERFGSYRIQPTALTFVAANTRPVTPTRGISETTVVAANLLNYFVTLDTGTPACGPTGTLDCRGANNSAEFTRQRAKTIAAIVSLDADIIGVIEVENSADDRALTDLVEGLNAKVGAGTYAHLPTGAIGTDAIRVGILYKPAAVAPRGVFALLTTEVDPNFLDSKNRPVLAQTFVTPAGDRFTLAVAHLKSKGSNCNDVGDPDAGDGQGNCNLTRTNAAKALAAWLESDPTGSEETDFLIVGDLNSYAQEDPITTLKTAGYTDLVASYGGAAAYSYVFDGQSGYLDHALASENMAPQVAGVAEWHINADEPRALDYNTEFKSAGQVTSLFAADAYRAADHDPLVVRLCFNHCAPASSLYLPAISR